MEWKQQAVILSCELIAGFVFGRIFIPYFRKIKTGKFEFYIGDRFAKDGSEPKFGGVVIMLTLLLGLGLGCVTYSSENISGGYDMKTVFAGVMLLFILLCTGCFEDYQKDTKRGIGMKPLFKWCIEFVSCFGFLMLVNVFGAGTTDVLMPFRLGYIHFGVLYYPLMALFMTLIINCVEVTDCTNGGTNTGVDGLCTLMTMIFSLGLSSAFAMGTVSETARLFAVCAVGATAGFLFWNLSPSKIYTGQSGSLLLGGLVVVTCVYSQLHLLLITAVLPFIINGVCALTQRIVYMKTKKLLFKGASLSEHLKNSGWGEYKIMCISALVSVVGAGMSVAFVIYAGKIII